MPDTDKSVSALATNGHVLDKSKTNPLDGVWAIETYREGVVCPSYAWLRSSVLSLLQKPVNVRLMSRTASGNEFQIEGPEVA